jgi:SnoaL-like domain
MDAVMDLSKRSSGERYNGRANAVTDADQQLRVLMDDREIRSLEYRYCRAIDRRLYDLLRSCYHPDATDHHGDFFGGVDDFVAHVQRGLAAFESTLHFVGNLQVEIDDDAARTEAYVLALARLAPSGSLPERDNTVALRYIDDLERRGGEWRILRRVCLYEWTRTDPVPPGWTFPGSFPRGRIDGLDPVFLAQLQPPEEIPIPGPRGI